MRHIFIQYMYIWVVGINIDDMYATRIAIWVASALDVKLGL